MQCKSLAFAVALFCAQGSALADAPVYAPLHTGNFNGSVLAESGPFGGAENWSFWTFHVPFMDTATVTVTPTSSDLDVFMAIWYGQESDTTNYFNMTSGSISSVLVDAADGMGPIDTGAGLPAQISFTNYYGNDAFVLAIADYTDGVGTGNLPYTIAASVPEVNTYAMLLAGLGLMAMARRRAA